ncbi:uncharacterized protein LOC132749041, partial [Ruditapes philippinarum]|uniref:uncharacterized protein LOC132749041 n=1 Tax=Ruditapes philippinarum TaxID=129788 RepID=UPI00295AE157
MSQIGRRAATPLEIEVVTVADYSLFNKWYELLDPSLPEAKKIEIAKQNLTTWLGTMVHSANLVYKRLEAHGLFISIKIVDLLIMTTEADSPWTETTKFKVNDTYFIDPDVVHSHFNPKSIELQKTIPHDHAMLLTRYTLLHGKNGTEKYAGMFKCGCNAYLGAECKPNSQSIVEDSETMYTAQTIAHELGHSLGCEHDGTNNTCKVGLGYCMEASYVKNNKNRWIFSSCSIDYIQEFVNRTNRVHKNCLAKVNDNHPKPVLALASQKWVGELYTVDKQCIISQGKGSFMCRDMYEGNFTEFCLKMWCYNPKDEGCYMQDGGDGTPCAAGSWCLSNNCVKDHRALSSHDDKCPFGDAEGVVHNNLTCKQIAATRPNDCLQYRVKQKCCASCKTAQTTPVPVDDQCKENLGSDSYFCRLLYETNLESGSRRDQASSYETLCEAFYCFNTSTNDSCSFIYAYDKTPCGHKKWCIDGKCVQDSNASDVSGCEYGDKDKACKALIESDPSNCYRGHNAAICCSSCSKYYKPSQKGCEYGDKDVTGCAADIKSRSDSYQCYGNNAKICCRSCGQYLNASNSGCEYGDKDKTCKALIESNPSNCYRGHNADICCSSCSKYYSPSIKGCEYGDKDVTGCADLMKSRLPGYQCYGNNAKICCRSCGQYLNASNVGCEYGDKSNYCATLIASKADAYHCYGGNADVCCGSCGQYYNPSHKDDKCPFGEAEIVVHKNLTCKQIAATRPNECLRQSVRQKCCVSCQTAQTTSVPVDEQCQEALGPGSYFCRGGRRYQVSSYEILCEDLYCFNASTNDSCSSIYAYDKTPCGHKKWCIDRKCVQDSNAPDVTDDCPVGDHDNDPSVSYSNMTCAEIRQHENNWACYNNYTKRQCCKTCEDVKTNAKGCEYGDKDKTCKTYIDSDPSHCYHSDTAAICCSSCSKYYTPSQKGCEYGDKDVTGCAGLIKSRSDGYHCYGNNAKICCRTCGQYLNASNSGCEYGDRSKDCAALIAFKSDAYHCYGRNADVCCGSCGHYYNPSHK